MIALQFYLDSVFPKFRAPIGGNGPSSLNLGRTVLTKKSGGLFIFGSLLSFNLLGGGFAILAHGGKIQREWVLNLWAYSDRKKNPIFIERWKRRCYLFTSSKSTLHNLSVKLSIISYISKFTQGLCKRVKSTEYAVFDRLIIISDEN